MSTTNKKSLFSNPRADVPAGLVVFLVAVPLCLGIAQASGAPLLSGLIAGIMGGLVVATISRAELSVSGPAAGLAVIVATGIEQVGFRGLLMAVMIAGALQIGMGALRLGRIAHFFPASVIRGMLAAIGVLIVLKQIPHAVGYDADFEGNDAFLQADGTNTFSALSNALGAVAPAAIAVTLACALALWLWPKAQRFGRLRLIPAPLMVVLAGAITSLAIVRLWPEGQLSPEHLVALPIFTSAGAVFDAITLPDWKGLLDPAIWSLGVTLAVVASLETLLSLEATDRLDPHKRISPPNRELIAQGTANLLSGAIGGLPVTAVIVRSSANVVAGGETRLSAIVHGLLLLVGVLFLGGILNTIPLASLAVVLIAVGLKLTTRKLWVSMWKAGMSQFLPFAITVGAVVFTDLLKGTLIGVVVAVIMMFREQRKNAALHVREEDDQYLVFADRDLTFLQKAEVKEALSVIPDGAKVTFDRSRVQYVDPDIEELLAEFASHCEERGIHLKWVKAPPDGASLRPELNHAAA